MVIPWSIVAPLVASGLLIALARVSPELVQKFESWAGSSPWERDLDLTQIEYWQYQEAERFVRDNPMAPSEGMSFSKPWDEPGLEWWERPNAEDVAKSKSWQWERATTGFADQTPNGICVRLREWLARTEDVVDSRSNAYEAYWAVVTRDALRELIAEHCGGPGSSVAAACVCRPLGASAVAAMAAGAVLAALGVTGAYALMGLAVRTGHPELAAKIQLWIDQVTNPATSALNPLNWDPGEDALVGELAQKMGLQSPSVTVWGQDTVPSDAFTQYVWQPGSVRSEPLLPMFGPPAGGVADSGAAGYASPGSAYPGVVAPGFGVEEAPGYAGLSADNKSTLAGVLAAYVGLLASGPVYPRERCQHLENVREQLRSEWKNHPGSDPYNTAFRWLTERLGSYVNRMMAEGGCGSGSVRPSQQKFHVPVGGAVGMVEWDEAVGYVVEGDQDWIWSTFGDASTPDARLGGLTVWQWLERECARLAAQGVGTLSEAVGSLTRALHGVAGLGARSGGGAAGGRALATGLPGRDPAHRVFGAVIGGAWRFSRGSYSVEQMERAVPDAILEWARKRAKAEGREVSKDDLKLPYKNKDGTVNRGGLESALKVIGHVKGVPADVLERARKELERARGPKKEGK